MKYKHQPTREEINGLKIDVKKDKKGNIKGFTIWADGYWVLDGSVMKDKDEDTCRIFTGNRVQNLHFEYSDGSKNYPYGAYLELRSKDKKG
jgi:hypothetical protein